MGIKLTAFCILMLGGALISDCATRTNEITIKDAWARPGKMGSNSAVYFTIDNPLPNADALLKAEGDIAESVELHESSMDDQGTMMMRPLELVPIDAKTKVEFKPGGLHVMLFSLKHDLNAGDQFTLTLHFQSNPDITLPVQVKESSK